jgi:hypothetical protein
MPESQEMQDVVSKVQELESTLNRLEPNVRLVINHLVHTITYLTDFATDKIDAMALRSRLGGLKDDLKRRL